MNGGRIYLKKVSQLGGSNDGLLSSMELDSIIVASKFNGVDTDQQYLLFLAS